MTDAAPDADTGVPKPPAGMTGELGPLLRLVRNQKVAFLLVGATNTAIGFGFFVAFQYTIGQLWGYLATLAFAHVFSVLCAFVLYRTFVFKVRGHVLRDLARFEVVYLVSLGVNFILLPIGVEVFGLAPIAAQALIVFVTTIISFVGHRSFSFRRAAHEKEQAITEETLPAAPVGGDAPLVSVVIPAYNNADHLDETLASVIAQTYGNLEIIVADHSSTDDTWAVMQRYSSDPRVTLLRTEAGGGALRNWNRVSQAATGELIKLVCGDDLLYPTIIQDQVAALVAEPSAVLAASARDIVDANGAPVVKNRGLAGLVGVHDGGTAIRKTITQGTNIFGEPGCVLMRRAALEKAGWWDSRWPYLIDEASYAAVLLQGKFVGVAGSLAGFRLSDGQWSVRLVADQAAQAIGFHNWMHEARPDLVSRVDCVVGNMRARVMAQVRRLAYLWLGRRMSKSVNTGAIASRSG
jgi:putative flippase GtrA